MRTTPSSRARSARSSSTCRSARGGGPSAVSRDDARVAADPAPTPRRTWLAAERTFLAWWRTGLAAVVAALGVGRVLPDVVDGPKWPFVALGLGYGVVAAGIFLAGARRE